MSDPRVKFFRDHAGYGWDPKTETQEEGRERSARELARAEEWLLSADAAHVEWRDDWTVGSHVVEFGAAYDNEPTTCEFAALYLGDDLVASLGCIDDADVNYRRVIEAELADEALSEILALLERI